MTWRPELSPRPTWRVRLIGLLVPHRWAFGRLERALTALLRPRHLYTPGRSRTCAVCGMTRGWHPEGHGGG